MGQVALMRAFFRLIVSAIAFVLAALLILTTETAADELGLVTAVRSVIRSGWQSMTDSAYFSIVYAGFIFSLGVAATMWTDYFSRRFRGKGDDDRSLAIFDLTNSVLVDDHGVAGVTVVGMMDGSHVMTIIFSEARTSYLTVPCSDAPIEVEECQHESKYCELRITAIEQDNPPTAIAIMAREFQSGDERFLRQEGQRLRAVLERRYSVLKSKGASRPLQWQ